VALALAVAAARARRRVLLVEINPFGRVGEYLGGQTLASEPVEVATNLSVVGITPAVIMEEFVLGILRIRALARRLLESATFRVVMAAAPGIDDFLTLVRIAAWENERVGLKRRRHRFDLIVVDAPATGHSVPLLATPGTLLEMLPFGPLASRARELALLLADSDRAAAVIVTRAEEMAVNETIELAAALMRIGVTILPPIVNAVPPLRFTRAESRRLNAEPPDVPDSFRPLVAAGRFSVARQRVADRQIRRLGHALATHAHPLPRITTAHFDSTAIAQLAEELERPTRYAS
jgi:anion-transporting  ArsA/GET3 family ATPase